MIRTARLVLFLLFIPLGAALPQSRNVSVSGVVREIDSDKPLPRATVELRSGTFRVPALTDGEGRFVFRDVPAGQYILTASFNGYLHGEYGRKMPKLTGTAGAPALAAAESRGPGGILNGPATATPLLRVEAGQPVNGIRLAMIPAAAISGRVFNAAGEPYPFVRVEAVRAAYTDGERTNAVISSVYTNDLGEYRLYGLPPGPYLVRADTRVQAQQQTPVAASITPPLPGGLVTQSAGGGIGYVGDPANQNNPLGNRGGRGTRGGANPVDALETVPILYRNATNERDATTIDLRPGDDVSGIDIVAAPILLIKVTVTVAGAANANVAVWPSAAGAGPRGGRGAGTDMSLPPGSYILSAIANAATGQRALGGAGPAAPQAERMAGYAAVELTPFGSPPAVTVSVNPLAGVSGRIILDAPGGTNTADLGRLSIRFRRIARIVNIPDPPAASPNAEGFFSARGFLDGAYVVEVVGFQNTLADAYVKTIRFAGTEATDDGVSIADQPSATLEIVIVRGAAELDGVVVSAKNGEPVKDATVVLAPDGRNRRDLYKTAVSDASGRFHLRGVAPGNYRVFAWEEELAAGSWFAPDFMRIFEGRGSPVVVPENGKSTIQAHVIPIL